jgi:hypothetical protein
MNHLLFTCDRGTHTKIVAVALVACIVRRPTPLFARPAIWTQAPSSRQASRRLIQPAMLPPSAEPLIWDDDFGMIADLYPPVAMQLPLVPCPCCRGESRPCRSTKSVRWSPRPC